MEGLEGFEGARRGRRGLGEQETLERVGKGLERLQGPDGVGTSWEEAEEDV